ncbi:hypothetical protein FPQ18DRAFT_387597 [Pyronema domesticum]|uniref:Azaphilone pigments biosynthesis cluster protein L N-terminal domain-containing protein n=1 Tax=Pyronema omphalodes (strain CBS 100304) TaxID=1076935 RepID=U4L1U2_PYROM|nr:hypothetical protein FPQ18DRAFT_387597 [Pyronema domesticum]CCX08581.1 Similar to predicted protein [Aspergillus terreus NIH2624]; acc. no. XP_001213559 [Pyronema omphalodes CBS 100304]
MDPLSLSASVAGLMSQAMEVTKILSQYTRDVKSALDDVNELSTEVSALSHVLNTAVTILRSNELEGTSFTEQSILSSVVTSCQVHINTIYRKPTKLQSNDKGVVGLGR